ncbi:hypothetical protein ACFX13_044053 [Malus domestica]
MCIERRTLPYKKRLHVFLKGSGISISSNDLVATSNSTMESSQSFFIAGQKPVHGTIDENVPRIWVALTENRATSKRNGRRSWKRTKNPPGSPG